MSAEGARDVISHVAPTFWIRLPKFDSRLATHRARKMRDRKGEKADGAGASWISPVAGCLAWKPDIQ
jgi:hypothetical protein